MSQSESRSIVPELLVLLLLLAVVRFVLVPVIQWQDDQALQINLLEKRYDKVSELMARDADYESLFEAALTAYTEARLRLFNVQDEASFKLERQVEIENIFAKHSLKVNNFGWNPGIARDEFEALIYPAVVRIEGPTFGLIQAMLEVEARQEAVFIADFEFRIQNQYPDSLGKSSGRIVLHFVSDSKGNSS